MTALQFFLQTLILRVISNINEDVYCPSIEDCTIECSQYRSCALSLIHCHNATKCTIDCSAQQSCSTATIYHTHYNQQIEINCSDEASCSFLRVQYEDDCDGPYSCREVNIYTNSTLNTLKLYCTDYRSCYRMNIYGNDIDYIEINCMAGSSCAETSIYALNATKGLNVTSYDKAKTQKVLPADDIYDFPACYSLYIYCPFTGCNINLIDSLYVDPYDINIYYPQGFSELNLECHFNALTNQSTCYDANYYCNLPDDKDGDNATDYVYHSTFDDYTGNCIGQCCDYIFSHSPTSAPSIAPTLAPSIAPSYSPSHAPTAAPTRNPTSFQFDAYFTAKFYIKFNDTIIIDKFNEIVNAWDEDIKEAMEYGYLSASSSYSYTEYMVSILNTTFVETNKINFTAKIYSHNDVVSHYAQFTENNVDFDAIVSNDLERKWNIENIAFDVYSSSIDVEYKEEEEMKLSDSNITLFALISFTICIWIIGFLSFLHTKHKLKCLNKLPMIKPCDDEQYMNIIQYGMQSLDLYSDIAFCWKIYVFSETLTNSTDITVITTLYSLSFVFFLLPYSINLIFAVIFEKFIDNKHLSVYTENYFAKYSKLFAVFVIVSGSVSASLQLINSSMFGHDLFHAGFSKYELSKMSKFRVLFTVVIENIPQFIIQLVYVTYFSGKDEDVVTFTFVVSTCSSIVSILSTIMAYFLQKQHIPKYQTKFNVEIVLVDDANGDLQLHRMESDVGIHNDSKFTIEVRDVDVKKLHKRGNLRKIMQENIAKCFGRLSANFELLYCVEQIDGLTFHGVCSSDNYNALYALFEKYEHELSTIVKKIYQLNRMNSVKKMDVRYWKIEFVVFDV